jgi:hypothetical protein
MGISTSLSLPSRRLIFALLTSAHSADDNPLPVDQPRQRELDTQRRAPSMAKHVPQFVPELYGAGRIDRWVREHVLELVVLGRPAARMVEAKRGIVLATGDVGDDSVLRSEDRNGARWDDEARSR